MSARNTLGQRTELRFAGKTMPLRYYALPALGIAVWVTVAFATGFAWDPLSLTFGGIVGGLLVFSSVLSRFRNWAVLRRDHVAISVWSLMPVGSRRVAYDKIERLQTDDLTGEVSIWYKNDLGEVDIIGLFLKSPQAASTLRDEIRLRQPRATGSGAADTPVDSQRATPPTELLPSGSEKRQFRLETSIWTTWGFILVSPLLALVVLVATGIHFSPLAWLVWTAFFAAFMAFFAILDKTQTYLVVDSHRVDTRSGLHATRHRMPYGDIGEVTSTESGWLRVVYAKPSRFLSKAGEETVWIRLKPHAAATVAAEEIKRRRDEAQKTGAASLLSRSEPQQHP